MIIKVFKLFFVFAISFTCAQNNLLNVTIEGMHCAGGCAKMIESSLNQNQGITAAVDFNNASASIIYDSELFSDVQILAMINNYRGGKFKAVSSSNNNVKCSKGSSCCQKTGKLNASCDNKSKGCCSSANTKATKKRSKKRSDNSLSSMIPGHQGCTKSCCAKK